MKKLSILICSLDERIGKLSLLLRQLDKQKTDEVEIITASDNRVITTGAKRNKLVNEATGKYACFIDDDDWVHDWYVEEILKAIETDPDAVAMNGIMTTNGRDFKTWDISMHNQYRTERRRGIVHYVRYHNHLSPVKLEIMRQFPFKDITIGEDFDYATRMHESGLIKTEAKIIRPMYEYRYISNK